MIFIDEPLPDDPLECEVVLHVREKLRRSIRSGSKSARDDLALLFNVEVPSKRRGAWTRAAESSDPEQIAAQLVAAAYPERLRRDAVDLGADASFVARCREWLQARVRSQPAFDHILATDLGTLLVLSRAQDLSVATGPAADGGRQPLPLIVRGETGTGKELLSKAIHDVWRAKENVNSQLHVVQVAGMPQQLISDELFGHEKGAYTGAEAVRKGRLELADEGTVLIDEIGDLPADAQVRLLRFLQDRVVERLGSEKKIPVRVRILAATWHDLDADVAAGRFRKDLLYRLRGASDLVLPPLRERKDFARDIAPQMLRDRRESAHTQGVGISHASLQALECHAWDGNLRELAAVLDEAASSAESGLVRLENLRFGIQHAYLQLPLNVRLPALLADACDAGAPPEALDAIVDRAVRQMELSVPIIGSKALKDQLGFINEIDSILERKATVRDDLVRLAKADAARAKAIATSQLVENVRADPVTPGLAQHALTRNIAQLTEQARTSAEDVARLLSAARQRKDQWLGLVVELTKALPQLDTEKLMNFLVAMLRTLTVVGPEFRDAVVSTVEAGGLRALRTKALDALQDEDKPSTMDAPTLPPGQVQRPRYLAAEDWRRLHAEHGTAARIAKHLNCDHKTVLKYLRQHGIVES